MDLPKSKRVTRGNETAIGKLKASAMNYILIARQIGRNNHLTFY